VSCCDVEALLVRVLSLQWLEASILVPCALFNMCFVFVHCALLTCVYPVCTGVLTLNCDSERVEDCVL